MVEIVYREFNEQADIAGKTIAEVRKVYEKELEIPDKAKAILNGKPVKREMEPRTELMETDTLTFEVKRRSRMPFFVGALRTALVVSGGLFAYTWTSANVSITATAASDIAAVSVANTPDIGNIFGHYRGDIPYTTSAPLDVFEIDLNDDYTGDMQVDIYLTNAYDLSMVYKHLNLMWRLVDDEGTALHSTADHEFELLTLENGRIKLDLDQSLIASGTDPSLIYVQLIGGGYTTHNRGGLMDWTAGYSEDPILFCEVIQR